MIGNGRRFLKKLSKKSKKGMRGYPIATIAYYGPTNNLASKVVCSIIEYENADPHPMKKWFSTEDIRKSETIHKEIGEFVDLNKVLTVSITDKTIGCPHEEGIDYPEGEYCPVCSFWKNRDRFTDEIVH